VQSHAGANDSELGLALLCIGAGALASMRLAGLMADRLGPAVMPLAFVAFAACAFAPALAIPPLAHTVFSANVVAASLLVGALRALSNAERKVVRLGREAAGPAAWRRLSSYSAIRRETRQFSGLSAVGLQTRQGIPDPAGCSACLPSRSSPVRGRCSPRGRPSAPPGSARPCALPR
jgi:hypothetical protein